MNRPLTAALGCLACVTMASFAEAQIVRIGRFGGVSVRAPFVSVDTLPFGGGARVRAPFVSINTRAYSLGYGYRPYRYDYYRPNGSVYYAPVYPAPAYTPPRYPSVVYPTTDSADANTGNRLRASALRLKRSLSVRRNDSDVWLDYLAPDRIVKTIDDASNPESLRDLVRNYDGVVSNPSLRSVSGASGFGETHRLLRAFVSRPADSSPATAATTNDQVEQGSVSVPGPVSEPGSVSELGPVSEPGPVSESTARTKPPTAVSPARPAGDGNKQAKEELPLPPPTPTPTPL